MNFYIYTHTLSVNYISRYNACHVFDLANALDRKKQWIGCSCHKMVCDMLQFDIWCQHIFKCHYLMVGSFLLWKCSLEATYVAPTFFLSLSTVLSIATTLGSISTTIGENLDFEVLVMFEVLCASSMHGVGEGVCSSQRCLKVGAEYLYAKT